MSVTRIVGSRSGVIKFTSEERPVANGVTVTDGDLVKIASGCVSSDTVTGKIYGIVTGGSSDDLVSRNYRAPATVGNATGTKKVLVQLVEDQIFEMTADASLDAASVGQYFLITGATGAQVVDESSQSATVGQVLCVNRIATNAAGTEFLKGQFIVVAPTSATTVA